MDVVHLGGRPAWPTARGLRSCSLEIRGFESRPPNSFFYKNFDNIVKVKDIILQ